MDPLKLELICLCFVSLTLVVCVGNVEGVVKPRVDLFSPEAIPGLTPFMLQRMAAAAWTSLVLLNFLNAFLVSCITTLGVFICTRFTKLGLNFPR